jgi:flagellin-like protein
MQFTQLLKDDDAVSPVIGVILMVAITVILAAVIGTFVLGLGDQVQQTAPNAQMSFDYDGTDLTITHDGGDALPRSDRTSVIVDGTEDTGNGNSWTGSDDITAGDSYTINSGDAGFGSSSTVRVTWESEDGGQTSTVGRWEGPDA